MVRWREGSGNRTVGTTEGKGVDLEEPLARELSLEGLSVESVHHCRRTVTLDYTFGKLSFPEDTEDSKI